MSTREVGDYEWRQVSMWEFTPDNCIEKFVEIEGFGGRVICNYYLQRIREIVSPNQWKIETVKELDGVPGDVLNWRNGDYRLKTKHP